MLLRANKAADARKVLAEALKKDAGSARAHELLGDAALSEKRFKDAVGEYKVCAADHAKDVKFLVKQAQAAQGAGDVEGAIAALDGVLAADPANAAAGVARAQLHRDQGQAGKAAALLGPVAAANPKDARVAVALAEARLEAGDLAGAQLASEAALALDKGSRGAHDVLGRVLYALGQKDAAKAHLEAACAQAQVKKGETQREAASGDALVALGDLELGANKKDAAKALAARAKTSGARRAPVLQAKLLQKDGDLNGAERNAGERSHAPQSPLQADANPYVDAAAMPDLPAADPGIDEQASLAQRLNELEAPSPARRPMPTCAPRPRPRTPAAAPTKKSARRASSRSRPSPRACCRSRTAWRRRSRCPTPRSRRCSRVCIGGVRSCPLRGLRTFYRSPGPWPSVRLKIFHENGSRPHNFSDRRAKAEKIVSCTPDSAHLSLR